MKSDVFALTPRELRMAAQILAARRSALHCPIGWSLSNALHLRNSCGVTLACASATVQCSTSAASVNQNVSSGRLRSFLLPTPHPRR